MLYDENNAEKEILALVSEVAPALPCAFTYEQRSRSMLVTIGKPEATAVVEFSEQRLVNALGLSSHPRPFDPEQRTAMRSDFDVAAKAARSAFSWAKGRFGSQLCRISIPERSVIASNSDQATRFDNGERLIYAYVDNDRRSLWRDAVGGITLLDA